MANGTDGKNRKQRRRLLAEEAYKLICVAHGQPRDFVHKNDLTELIDVHSVFMEGFSDEAVISLHEWTRALEELGDEAATTLLTMVKLQVYNIRANKIKLHKAGWHLASNSKPVDPDSVSPVLQPHAPVSCTIYSLDSLVYGREDTFLLLCAHVCSIGAYATGDRDSIDRGDS